MSFFSKKVPTVLEQGVEIGFYGEKISKDLKVFYNPAMKFNRDISILVMNSYFDKAIKFCDPMAASGIREIRMLKNIDEKFEKVVMGDISKTAIANIKKNFKRNKISLKKVQLFNQDAISTINSGYFHYIEVDPFGSPLPFLDIALQRIKHNGILSVTATDTAAFCGTYPKTTYRKYGIRVIMTYFHEELGLRNLIAYCCRQAAKYDKSLRPIVSYSKEHYYKVFFEVVEGRGRALKTVKDLKYIQWDKKSQMVKICDFESKDSCGKTFVGSLCDKDFLNKLIDEINILPDSSEAKKMISKLLDEIDLVGYYNPHKFQKKHNFHTGMKFKHIFEELEKKGFNISKVNNNPIGIKTNASCDEFLKVLKKK